MANKFKKNDDVLVIAGASKGKKGKISSISGGKAIVSGVNLATIHKKPTQSESGSIIKKEKPIDISNLSHLLDGKAVKVRYEIKKGDGKCYLRKRRQDKKGGNIIDN